MGSDSLSSLVDGLLDSISLIDSSDIISASSEVEKIQSNDIVSVDFSEPESLIAKCDHVCNQYKTAKPSLRVIHHFACSGGTLISKCISALPNVYLLSEVHPYTDLHMGGGKPKFLPSDISTLSRYANIPNIEVLQAKLFFDNIRSTYEHTLKLGGSLVLRDHTHSDFHTGLEPSQKSALLSILSDYFDIKSLITMRDPIDSFLSLDKAGWSHFSPYTFDEYCSRIISMLTKFDGVEVIKYEDFVDRPCEIMKQVCASLTLDYDESFQYIFDLSKVTGDSGRSSSIISMRSRRDIPAVLANELASSKSYRALKLRFGY